MQKFNYAFKLMTINILSIGVISLPTSGHTANDESIIIKDRNESWLENENFASKTMPSNPAISRIEYLNSRLSTPALPPEDRIEFTQELYELLSSSGPAYIQYGPISGPISSKSPYDLPLTSSGAVINPSSTIWLPSAKGFTPTNDWFEQMGCYTSHLASNNTGLYRMSYLSGSVIFNTAESYVDHEDPLNPAHGWVEQILDNGFALGSTAGANANSVIWDDDETGNMLRDIVYTHFTIHACQGSAFQFATYNNRLPKVGLKTKDNSAITSESTLSDGTKKYRIETATRIYLFYGNPSLEMNFNKPSSRFMATNPYTGHLSAISLPNDDNAIVNEQIADTYSGAVIVRAHGSLLPNSLYNFVYVCQNLSGQPTAQSPLILLKAHQEASLLPADILQPLSLSYLSLTGTQKAYANSSFTFRIKSTGLSTQPLPLRAPGSPSITVAQARTLINSGIVDQGLQDAWRYPVSITSTYKAGKELYQLALTLAYAQKMYEIANVQTTEATADKLQLLYQKLRQEFTKLWGQFKFDSAWGTIVPSRESNGARTNLNEHIAQYGYPLYALSLLKDFEDQYIPAGERFLNLTVPLAGYTSYTNADMGDLLAEDICQTGGAYFPLFRNLDIYNAHSWLSGVGGPSNDGNNTGSESEAVTGCMAVTAWLERTQPNTVQRALAQTRWALETQGLQTYFQIGDPTTSVYYDNAPTFVNLHLVVSLLFDNKYASETFWGNQWDRILASESMPAGANLMDNYLKGNPQFALRAANAIIQNWSDFDTTNPIQSILIPIVAKTYPLTAQELITDLELRGPQTFDPGTNRFILKVISQYALNQHHYLPNP